MRGFHLPLYFVTQSNRRPIGWRRGRWRSLGFALEGLWTLLREEPNARIQLLCAACAIGAGLLLGISPADWRWIVLAIGLVLAAEAGNSALERSCDSVQLDPHPLIKAAKDVAAGAVLLTALMALAIGALTFAPYLLERSAASGAVP